MASVPSGLCTQRRLAAAIAAPPNPCSAYNGVNVATTATSPAGPLAAHSSSARSAVERYFEVSLFLLIATGFLTLASTGRLDFLSLIFISGVLITRALLLARNRTVVIPERWANLATVAYVAFYAADYLLLSRSFVVSSVHLVLFIMAFKVLTR